MRVLLLNQVFYPDVAATAQHGHDLARHLVEQGHDVAVIASRSLYGKTGAELPRRETVDGIEIHRVGINIFGKRGIVARLLDFLIFYVAATIKTMTIRRADVIVCFTTPPFIAMTGWLVKLIRGSKYVYWVMDLYPDVPVAMGMMKPRSIVTRVFEALNRFCLRRADRVVVLGRCMQQRVLDKGIAAARVVHINVWADHEEVHPISHLENKYRSQWNLGDTFVVMYSGNIGLVHDMQTIYDAAEILRDEDIHFLIVGDGKRRNEVADFAKTNGLTNLHLEPYQPRDRLNHLLSCPDVHLISLMEGFEGLVVPSKLFGIMAAGRPSLFIGHPESEIARIVKENSCGVVIRRGDAAGLAQAIQELHADAKRLEDMGARARSTLMENYDRRIACGEWQQLLESVVESGQVSGSSREKQHDAAA